MSNFNIAASCVFAFMVMISSACDGQGNSHSEVENVQREHVYTRISECKEVVENSNAAFSELSCANVGGMALTISIQKPTYFIVNLGEASSEFEVLSGELPLEVGTAIEWPLVDGRPRYMIFRLKWGTEEDPFNIKERLVVSYVSKDRICPLATVDGSRAHANEKARALISEKFSSIKECPASVQVY